MKKKLVWLGTLALFASSAVASTTSLDTTDPGGTVLVFPDAGAYADDGTSHTIRRFLCGYLKRG